MPANERGSLRAAFTNFSRPESEKEAELKLLGRTAESTTPEALPKPEAPQSYQVATSASAQPALVVPPPAV